MAEVVDTQVKDSSGAIYRLIGEVIKAIVPPEKKRGNKSSNFKSGSIDAFYSELQPLFSKHGIFSVPNVLERTEEKFQLASGRLVRVVLKVVYHFIAVEDGSRIEVGPVYGEGHDTSVKASRKALSMAHESAFIQLFAIPSDEPADGSAESPTLPADATRKQNTSNSLPTPNQVGTPSAKQKQQGPPKQNAASPADSSTSEQQPESLGDIVCKVGKKFKGKKLKDVDSKALADYLTWFEGELKSKNRKPSNDEQEFLWAANAYLESLGTPKFETGEFGR